MGATATRTPVLGYIDMASEAEMQPCTVHYGIRNNSISYYSTCNAYFRQNSPIQAVAREQHAAHDTALCYPQRKIFEMRKCL